MAPSDGHTAVIPPNTGGFSFGRSGQWSGSPFAEDAPLSSFASPGGFMPNDSASSMTRHRREQPQRNGSADSSGRGSSTRPSAPALPSPSPRRPDSAHARTAAAAQATARRHSASSASSARDVSDAIGAAEEGLGSEETPQPPPGSWAASMTAPQDVPSNMDAASYAAGERAALLRAFREALPGQQALGELRAATARAQGRIDEEGERVRALQTDAADLRAAVQGVAERVLALETGRLPQLDARLDAVAAAGPSQEFRQTLAALQQVLAGLAEREPVHPGAAFGAPAPATVSRAVHGYAAALARGVWAASCGAAAQADAAALALARKLLLDESAPSASASQAKPSAEPAADTARAVLAKPSAEAAADSARAVLGAALMVAAVEAATAAQLRAAALAPRAVNHAAAPLQLGLRVARVAVWAAALALSAARVRAAFLAAADAIVSAVRRLGDARASRKKGDRRSAAASLLMVPPGGEARDAADAGAAAAGDAAAAAAADGSVDAEQSAAAEVVYDIDDGSPRGVAPGD